MAIHINCPFCNERLIEMKTDCSHCGESLPAGVMFALSMALDGGATSVPTSPMSTRIHPHSSALSDPLVQLQVPESDVLQTALPLTQTSRNSRFRPWLASGLSIFCGLGQLYNGQCVKGMILIILATALAASFRVPWVMGLIPILWIYAIIDAYVVARRHQS